MEGKIHPPYKKMQYFETLLYIRIARNAGISQVTISNFPWYIWIFNFTNIYSYDEINSNL